VGLWGEVFSRNWDVDGCSRRLAISSLTHRSGKPLDGNFDFHSFLIFFTCLLFWGSGAVTIREASGVHRTEPLRRGSWGPIKRDLVRVFRNCSRTLIALFVTPDRRWVSVGSGPRRGSALLQRVIIPAACILSVVGFCCCRERVTSVNVSRKVLLRGRDLVDPV